MQRVDRSRCHTVTNVLSPADLEVLEEPARRWGCHENSLLTPSYRTWDTGRADTEEMIPCGLLITEH